VDKSSASWSDCAPQQGQWATHHLQAGAACAGRRLRVMHAPLLIACHRPHGGPPAREELGGGAKVEDIWLTQAMRLSKLTSNFTLSLASCRSQRLLALLLQLGDQRS
jgi:hypothetical protein